MHFRDGANLTDPALVQHRDPVPDRVRAAHVVRDHHGSHPKALARPDDQPVDHGRGHGVEAGGGLVIQDITRPQGDRAGNADALPHPPGELGGILVARPSEVHDSQRFRDPLVELLPSQLSGAQPDGDVVGDRHRVEQRRELEYVANVAAQRVQGRSLEGRHRAAVHNDLAGVRLQQTHDVLQGDALPGAGVPDDHHGLAVPYLEREAGEHLFVAERLAEVLKLDHRSSVAAQKASSMRISTAAYTWACVVLRPTPSAPPCVPSPTMHATIVIANPKLALLSRPNQVSLN